jgi:hypothetical protein
MFSQTLFGAATEIVHTIPTLNGISHFRRPTAVGTRITRATCFQQEVWLSDVHGVHQFFDGVVQRGGYYWARNRILRQRRSLIFVLIIICLLLEEDESGL